LFPSWHHSRNLRRGTARLVGNLHCALMAGRDGDRREPSVLRLHLSVPAPPSTGIAAQSVHAELHDRKVECPETAKTRHLHSSVRTAVLPAAATRSDFDLRPDRPPAPVANAEGRWDGYAQRPQDPLWPARHELQPSLPLPPEPRF